MPVTWASKKKMTLDWVPYIYYFICFKKNKVKALINSSNEINVITLTYIVKLGLKICHIYIEAQKIDSFILKIFEIVFVSFQIEDKLD